MGTVPCSRWLRRSRAGSRGEAAGSPPPASRRSRWSKWHHSWCRDVHAGVPTPISPSFPSRSSRRNAFVCHCCAKRSRTPRRGASTSRATPPAGGDWTTAGLPQVCGFQRTAAHCATVEAVCQLGQLGVAATRCASRTLPGVTADRPTQPETRRVIVGEAAVRSWRGCLDQAGIEPRRPG